VELSSLLLEESGFHHFAQKIGTHKSRNKLKKSERLGSAFPKERIFIGP
jgi:hypothetical protein